MKAEIANKRCDRGTGLGIVTGQKQHALHIFRRQRREHRRDRQRVERFHHAGAGRMPRDDLAAGIAAQIVDAGIGREGQEDIGRIDQDAAVPCKIGGDPFLRGAPGYRQQDNVPVTLSACSS